MKKHTKTIFLIAALLLLVSCAPATNPNPPEIPATEPPASTEEPMPEVSRIAFYFQYNFVPENWIENYTEREIITFYPNGDEWSTQALSPVYLYKGPLFPIQMDHIQNKSGNCGINSVPTTDTNNNQQMLVKPICTNPNAEESAISSVRLPNCDRDSNLKLTCKYFGEFGVLQYTLNKEQDIFEFQYSGSWDLSFEHALNTSLPLIGFTSPNEEFYRTTEPNKIYTIKKD